MSTDPAPDIPNKHRLLTDNERDLLIGDFDGSDGYKRKLKHQIRKKIQGGLADLQLIRKNMDEEELLKVPRDPGTDSVEVGEKGIDDELAKSALDSAGAVGSAFGGAEVGELTNIFIEVLDKYPERLRQHDNPGLEEAIIEAENLLREELEGTGTEESELVEYIIEGVEDAPGREEFVRDMAATGD